MSGSKSRLWRRWLHDHKRGITQHRREDRKTKPAPVRHGSGAMPALPRWYAEFERKQERP